jgi:hypothetical protein
MKGIPNDVFINYLEKNEQFILVKDPKHTDSCYHYTIWSINEIKDIFEITQQTITKLDEFINKMQIKKYFKDEKMFFTYPPTHDRLHLHIVPYNYVSYRPINEIYCYKDICNKYK